MTLGEWFQVILIIQYLAASGIFALEGNWARMFYFLCAAGITISVLMMR